HLVVEDQRRTGLAPDDVRQPILGQRIAAPQVLAGRGVEAVEDAGAAQRVDAIANDGRRGARAVTALFVVQAHVVFVLPARLAGLQFVADDQFLVFALLLRDGVVAYDGERGPAQTDASPPQFLRGPCLPIAAQAHTVDHAVAIA